MKHFLSFFMLCWSAAAYAQTNDSVVGRPYSEFDVVAFCTYKTFHPTHYLTDNNWEILCAFTTPGSKSALDSLGISYNNSQLQLLRVGDLLGLENGVFTTKVPIFGKQATEAIRRESKQFADSIFPIIQPEIRRLVKEFNKAGYSKQVYSLVFSYLLDRYIWDDERLADPASCEKHGTWSGAYWAMYNKRNRVKTGTNGYGGSLQQNWTDDLGYWLSLDKMLAMANEINKTDGRRIEDSETLEIARKWGIADADGNILIPVLHRGNGDSIDLLCQSITSTISDAVKRKCLTWGAKYGIESERLAQIIFYHEVMWDLLDILEAKRIITMPAILRGEEVTPDHKADNLFIVIDE